MLSFSYAFLSFFSPSARPRIAAATTVPSRFFLFCVFLAFITCLGMSQHLPFCETDLETMAMLHVSKLGMLHAA